jgi:hypothetical protein
VLRLIVDWTDRILRTLNTVSNISIKKAFETLLQNVEKMDHILPASYSGQFQNGVQILKYSPPSRITSIQTQSAVIPNCYYSDSKSNLQLQENRSGWKKNSLSSRSWTLLPVGNFLKVFS